MWGKWWSGSRCGRCGRSTLRSLPWGWCLVAWLLVFAVPASWAQQEQSTPPTPGVSLTLTTPGLSLLVQAKSTLTQLVSTLTQQESLLSEQKQRLVWLGVKVKESESSIESLSGQLLTLSLELENSRKAQVKLQDSLGMLWISLDEQSRLSEMVQQAASDTVNAADRALGAAMAKLRARAWWVVFGVATGFVAGWFADWVLTEVLHVGS